MREAPHPSWFWQGVRQVMSAVCFRVGMSVAPIALLIDGDNIAADCAVHILAEAGKFGGVVIRRVYGNWAVPAMAPWRVIASHYGMMPVHHAHPVARKNAGDIALTVDAMKLYHQGVRHFCLASGDSDYIPLIRQLREGGCFVLGIGKSETLASLKTAYSVFVSTDQLAPASSRSKQRVGPDASIPPLQVVSGIEPSKASNGASDLGSHQEPDLETQLIDLLKKAYRLADTKGGNEWVSIGQFGSALQQLQPGFTPKAYGSAKLKQLVGKYPQLFEKQPQKAGQITLQLKELETVKNRSTGAQ